MSEELVIRQCSPTLAGLKTGNLFSCSGEGRKELLESLRRFNRDLVPRGARMIPLRVGERSALVYLYRPERLKRDLGRQKAQTILRERGYTVGNVNRCLAELIRRLADSREFPHEIGQFLGYPAEDVEQFIRQRAKNAKLVGTWKVYGDVEKARHTFALYQKCTRVYREVYRKNPSFDRLVVNSK